MPNSQLKRRSRVSSSIWENCPPKTHALYRLKGMLSQLGLHTSDLEDLKLNFLTRMHTSTRYPSEDLPPVQLSDQSDGEECLENAEKFISFTQMMKKGDAK